MMALYNLLGKHFATISGNCFAFVGANSFARITLPMRMNSHLQVFPKRLPEC
jgi:hypothetical protein